MISAVTFIVFAKDLIREKRYISLIKSAVFTLLINLWYLIPFITYYFGVDLAIRHTAYNTEYFSNAIFPAEMFNFFNDKFGYSQLIPLGIRGNMSLSLGVGVTFCFVIAAVYFIFERKNKLRNYTFYVEMFLFTVFIMFMASTLFPSELLQKPKLFNSIAGTIRMPWRFLSLASPIICIVSAAVVSSKVNTDMHKKIIIGTACLICSISFVFFGTAYTTEFDAAVKIGQAAPNAGAPGWDNEYFVQGTNINNLEPEQYEASDDSIQITSYEKKGTNIALELSGAKNSAYVEVPLLYYPGYSAKDIDGNRLDIVKGTNNVLRVQLHDGSDNIKIKYSGLIIFKISCIISFLTVAFAVFYIYCRKKGIQIGYNKRKN